MQDSPNRNDIIERFLKENHLSPKSFPQIDVALTHKSYANEFKGSDRKNFIHKHNQRLEFLGDAVLGLTIANYLYQKFPNQDEGELTKKKAQAVCESSLVSAARRLDLGNILLLGRGELSSGGARRDSNLADAMEAIIGAVFLSEGFEQAEKFILDNWEEELSTLNSSTSSVNFDYKSALQEHLIRRIRSRPEYRIVGSEGPDHEKTFHVGLFIQGEEKTRAEGPNRKMAEQKAAEQYMREHDLIG